MLKVEAVDSDKGINDPVIYSISSENGGVPGLREGWGFCQSHWKQQLLLPLTRLHKARLV